MLRFDELVEKIGEFQAGSLDIDDFEDWFREHSRGAYASSSRQVREAVGLVESAFSKFHYEGLDEAGVRVELVQCLGELESIPLPLRVASASTGQVIHNEGIHGFVIASSIPGACHPWAVV